MSKIYLFVHNGGVEERTKLTKILDAIPEIETWRYDMQSSFYLLSNSPAQVLAQKIRARWPEVRFIVAEITSNYFGWLTDETWYLFRNKRHKPGS